MKNNMRILIILITVIFFGNNTFAADKTSTNHPIDTPAVIKKIRSDFALINKQLSFYQKKTKDVFEMSAEGGEVTGYYNKGVLKKIHCIFYGETGKAEADYYFNSAGLFFLYKKETFYDKPMYLKDFKIKNTTETRYYLNGDQVIRKLAKPIASSTLSYKEIKAELKPIMDILNKR